MDEIYNREEGIEKLKESYNSMIVDLPQEKIEPMLEYLAKQIFPESSSMALFYKIVVMKEKRLLGKVETINVVPKYYNLFEPEYQKGIKEYLELQALAPRIFISYTHDNLEHKKWVLGLAEKLMKNGIYVVLDQWDLKPGQDIYKFTTDGIERSDRVIIIVTPSYLKKSSMNNTGSGLERMIITGELAKQLDTDKFIPIIKHFNESRSLPIYLGNRLYVDFSKDDEFEKSFESLVRVIHGKPESNKPELGKSSF